VPRDEPDDTWVALSETPVQDRPRVHLDLYASDQAAEIDRLLGLGASHVDWQDYPEGVDFAVLADTDGAASA
jgi:hypothetical protein